MLSLDGAIDIHVHSSPEVFGRIGDAVEIARRCEAAGMRAVVFKAHHEGTTTRAYHANRELRNLTALGGLVLNDFVGGINPVAVKAALDQGAKIIWAPTMHSKHHEETFGGRGTYGIKRQTDEGTIQRPGIEVLDARGQLSPALVQVLELVQARGRGVRHRALLPGRDRGRGDRLRLAHEDPHQPPVLPAAHHAHGLVRPHGRAGRLTSSSAPTSASPWPSTRAAACSCSRRWT